jgi:hypothetical protein
MLSNLGCKQRTKSVPPEPDGLIADVDPLLVKKVLDVPQRKRKPDIHHDGKVDDLGAGAKVPEGAAFGHLGKPLARRARLNFHRSDRAVQSILNVKTQSTAENQGSDID